MNDEVKNIHSEGEDPSQIRRRPVRRASRTIAPFAANDAQSNINEANVEQIDINEANDEAVSVERLAEKTIEMPSIPDEDSIFNLLRKESTEAECAEAAPDPTTLEQIRTLLKASEESAEAEAEAEQEKAEESPAADESIREKSGENALSTDENEAEADGKEEKLSSVAEIFDWVKSFLFSLAAVIFVFTLIFRGVTVNGGSMLPTLENNEYLIISNLLYTPKTGDIVVVQSPHYKNATEPLIKRIIATGGQTVKINFSTWEVWVDGKLLEEDYILKENSSSMNREDLDVNENGFAEFRVEDNCIFVMGDHRNDSLDSRSNSVGQIDERYIMGRVMLRLTPLNRFGKVA